MAKIKKLAAAKKYKEIDILISEVLKGDLTDKEKGAIYIFLASVYLKARQHFNNRYERALDQALSNWQEIEKRFNKMEEKTQTAMIKKKIAKL